MVIISIMYEQSNIFYSDENYIYFKYLYYSLLIYNYSRYVKRYRGSRRGISALTNVFM